MIPGQNKQTNKKDSMANFILEQIQNLYGFIQSCARTFLNVSYFFLLLNLKVPCTMKL